MDYLRPRNQLVTMTFTVDELAFISGAVVAIGDKHDLIDRIHTAIAEAGLFD